MSWTEVVNRFTTKEIFKDIRFWIILFSLLRLYGITNPPLEIAHNWRQTTVTMVSRNFVEADPNIFYPRIDIAGDKTGITGMEFPLFNYLIYLASLIFGYDHWYGRLINLLVSSIGVFYFYKLVKKYFTQKIAFNSAFVLMMSFWFAYSRKIMPDTFASSLVIMSIYYGTNYLEGKKSFQNLLPYVLLGTLGVLSKLPVAYIWIIYSIWFFSGKIETKRKIIFAAATLIIFSPVYYWYFIWVPFLVEEYGFWHFFMGDSIEKGFKDAVDNFPRIINHFYEGALKYSGFLMFLVGLFFAIKHNQRKMITLLVLSTLAFSVIIIKSGHTFAYHSYYIIPFVPVMALFAGYGISQINKPRLVYFILFVLCIETILNQWNDFIIKPLEKPLITLESDLDQISDRSDLIVINSENVPTPMYFAHRKGWVTNNNKLSDKNYLNDLKNEGCKYIVVIKHTYQGNLFIEKEIVFENEFFKIFRN